MITVAPNHLITNQDPKAFISAKNSSSSKANPEDLSPKDVNNFEDGLTATTSYSIIPSTSGHKTSTKHEAYTTAESIAKKSAEGSRDRSKTEFSAKNQSAHSTIIVTTNDLPNTSIPDYSIANQELKSSTITEIENENAAQIEELGTNLALVEENINNTLLQMKDEVITNLERVQSNITKIGEDTVAQIDILATNLTAMEENINNNLLKVKDEAIANLERLQSNITKNRAETLAQIDKLASDLTSMKENIENDIRIVEKKMVGNFRKLEERRGNQMKFFF